MLNTGSLMAGIYSIVWLAGLYMIYQNPVYSFVCIVVSRTAMQLETSLPIMRTPVILYSHYF